jgi:hypothetical protein
LAALPKLAAKLGRKFQFLQLLELLNHKKHLLTATILRSRTFLLRGLMHQSYCCRRAGETKKLMAKKCKWASDRVCARKKK